MNTGISPSTPGTADIEYSTSPMRTALVKVQRKGKTVTPKIFLVKAVRGYLDGYLDEERGREAGPLFQTRSGKRFSIQQVDCVLKKLAGLANATISTKEQIHVHPHILRYTMMRKVREEKGVEYAIEYAGHVSENTFGDTPCPPNKRQNPCWWSYLADSLAIDGSWVSPSSGPASSTPPIFPSFFGTCHAIARLTSFRHKRGPSQSLAAETGESENSQIQKWRAKCRSAESFHCTTYNHAGHCDVTSGAVQR